MTQGIQQQITCALRILSWILVAQYTVSPNTVCR